MRGPCAALAVVIALALSDSATLAQERITPLSRDEIRSQILDHKFDGYFASDEDGNKVKGNAYFGADGKFLLQIDVKSKPSAIILGKLELKDDQVCVQQTGAMRDALQNRCFEAYGSVKDGAWSGGLSDVQDGERGIPLDWGRDLDPAELDALWTNWQSLQKEAGPIDAFGSMEDISINPYRFKGKVLLIKAYFKQMIGDGRAWFNPGNSFNDLIVEGVANDLFQDSGTALLIGEFNGSFRMTVEGSDVFLPVMTLRAARTCKDSSCKEYVQGWQ